MNGDRRSQDGSSGFFGVASPPTSSSGRLRPQSAGTRLRQKPAPPSHQDLFASLGIDAHSAANRSSLFSNRGSTASVSSTSGPSTTTNTSSASLYQYGAPPHHARGAFAVPPLSAAAGPPTGASHWSASSTTSRFGGSTTGLSSVNRAPPVASTFRATTTSFGANPTTSSTAFGLTPAAAAAPAPLKTTSASLFSMEDADAFELDDGWGCDSPSAVLSPTGLGATPSEPAASASTSTASSTGMGATASSINNDFGWDDTKTDKQFGVTPPKPAPAPSTASPFGLAAPPPAAPPASSTFAFSAPSPPPPPQQQNHQAPIDGPAAAVPTPQLSVSFATPVATPTPPPAPVAELEYNERTSWGEPWEDADPFAEQKDASIAAGVDTNPQLLSLDVPAAESIPVENEFWGDNDDDALFDDDEHANDKWDETPVAHDPTRAIANLSLHDDEAASTDDAGVHEHHESAAQSTSSFGASITATAASPHAVSFGDYSSPAYDASAHAENHAFSGLSGRTDTASAVVGGSDDTSEDVSSAEPQQPTVAFSGRDEYAPDVPPSSPFHDIAPAQDAFSGGSENYFASSPAKSTTAASTDAFAQPVSLQPEFSTSDFGESAPHETQRRFPSSSDCAVVDKSGESESLAPELSSDADVQWNNSASPSKFESFSSNSVGNTSSGFYPQHAETVASVQLEASDATASTAFGYSGSSSSSAARDEARFYAAVREHHHENSSTASVSDVVSSAGATFGGSDYVRSDTFSDGTFSETRSVIGSSNASTAFGTDFPSVSEGFSAAATTFGGSDYVSDGQYSDGNVSETPSLNESSSHPGLEASPEHAHAHDEQYFNGDSSRGDRAAHAFEMTSHESSSFSGSFPPPASPAGLFNHESGATGEAAAADPFASSDAQLSASPFGVGPPAVETANSTAASEPVPTAAAGLFGETAGSDVPNPFGDDSAPSLEEKELPVADADNLFALSPTAAGFGAHSFDDPPQQQQQQQYDQTYHQHAYDQGFHQQQQHNQSVYAQSGAFGQTPNEFSSSAHFGHNGAASASALFGASPSQNSSSSYDGFSANAFGQSSGAASAFASHSQFDGAAGAHYGESEHRASEHQFANQDAHAASGFGALPQSDVRASAFQDQHQSVGFPSSVATPAASTFSNSSAAPTSNAQQQQPPPTMPHEFSQSHSELLKSGFSDSYSSNQFAASAQDFFGGASGGAVDSFASSNEFFGGAADEFAQQPSLSRGASDASAYDERNEHQAFAGSASTHFQQEQPQQHQHQQEPLQQHQEQHQYQQEHHQQSWPQADSSAHSGFSDAPSVSAPPCESFGAPPHVSESHSSHVQERESFVANGASSETAQMSADVATSEFAPPPPPPAPLAPEAASLPPQEQHDTSSYFGSASQETDEFASHFASHASADVFGAPPAQDPQQQQPSASSYFGEQPHESAPAAYGGFEQSVPGGFDAAPSEFFLSTPQQQQQQQPDAAFGSNATSASYKPFEMAGFDSHGHASGSAAPSYARSSSYGAAGYSAAGYGVAHQQQASSSSKYKDPCVPAPSCLASFGFGGNVVTMFPKRKLRLNIAGSSFRHSPRAPVPSHPDNSELGELRKGPVSVYRMDQIHPMDRHFEQLEAFPGPLTENVGEDVVLQYLDDQLKDVASPSSEHEDERLLSGILRILVKCNGKLRSEPSANPSDPDSPEVQLVTLLRESDHRRRGNVAPTFPAPKPAQLGMHSEALAKHATSIRDLLLVGDRKAAVDVAIHAQMWPEAMLIASFTDKDEYKRVLRTYMESHYAVGDPCRALYLSFADQQEKSVMEPQNLLELSHPHHNDNEPGHGSASSILGNWVTHAQVLLANRTGDTNKILIELGDRLWNETGSILAAHVCYLSAGIPVEAPSPSSKIALLGADHRTPKEARFYVSSSAVQRTEIYEWIQRRAAASATHMVPFQGYKLIYAMILADHGKLEAAFKYVSSMLAVIKGVTATMKPGTSMYLEGMQNQLTVLDDRLRQHLGQHRVNSVAAASSSSNKQGKWGIGSALSIMGKIVNRVVEGNDSVGAPTATTTQLGPQQGPGSSLFPGAPLSNSSSAVPSAYPNAPSPAYSGYSQQVPAPLSNDARAVPRRAPSPAFPGYSQQPPVLRPALSTNDLHTPPSYSGFGHQPPALRPTASSNDLYATPTYPGTPSQSFQPPAPQTPSFGGVYGQPGLQNPPRSNDLHAIPTYPGTPSQSFQPPAPQTPSFGGAYGQPGLRTTLSSNDLHTAPSYPGTPSQSFQSYNQQQQQQQSADPCATPRSSSSMPGFPSPALSGYGHAHVPASPAFPGYGQQPPPRSNDASASTGFQREQLHYGHRAAPRSNESSASRQGYSREQPASGFVGYNQQHQQPPHVAAPFDPSSSVPQNNAYGASGVAPPSSGPGSNPPQRDGSGPGSHDGYAPLQRLMTAPPASNGSDSGAAFPSPYAQAAPHQQLYTPGSASNALHRNTPHISNSAPSSMPASPSTFQKPTLDLSGDAGKGVVVPPRRSTSDGSRSPTAAGNNAAPPLSSSSDSAGAVPNSGPSSDKGSASPKFKDTKKPTGRSKTPPPSGSPKASSSWFPDAFRRFVVTKMHPEAKVAKIGKPMEAYYDEETKRWVFPGETAADEPVIPSAPPTGPLPGSTPASHSGGLMNGPPGTHSAPGSISGGGAVDPLAALMAPPPARAHAALMKKDPLSAMMAPPMRPGMPGQRATSMGSAQRKPPRPQFAVFKPAPQAPAAPEAAEE